jgi:hypothetical protein
MKTCFTRALYGVTFLSSLLAGGGSLYADLIAYDPFLSGSNRGAGEYTAGTDMRTMGAAALGWQGNMGVDGFGIAHAGSSGNFVANASGENSAAVDYEQGGRMQWIGVGNFPFNRNITRQLNATPASGEWWMSIMVNRLAWADSATNTYVVGGFTDAAGTGIQIGYDDTLGNNIPDLVVRSGGLNTVIRADTASSDNQFVIAQLLIDQSGNDVLNLWVDPATIAPLGLPDVVITDQNITDSLTPFTQSKYESPGQSGVVFFDEIRLATSFNSLVGVPEPSTLVGAALAMVAGLAWVRRR